MSKKKEFKTSLRKRLQSKFYYHKRTTFDRLSNPLINKINTQEDWDRIRRLMTNILESIHFTIQYYGENERYSQCISDKFREISRFWRNMESVGFNVGKYINVFGFHEDFLPQSMFDDKHVKSTHFVECVEKFTQYVNECKAELNLGEITRNEKNTNRIVNKNGPTRWPKEPKLKK